MSVRSAQAVTVEFTTRVWSTGVGTNADSLPVGTLVLNGMDNGASVTVTNVDTGRYKCAVTLPTLAVGDVVELSIAATVSSVADKAIVRRDSKDFFAGSIPDVAAGGAGGLFIAGTNAATTVTTSFATTFTGNLTGSVASVTGAVGSVTAGVTVSANNDKTGYALTAGEETAVADALLKRDLSAVTGEAARSALNALRKLMNKWDTTTHAGKLTVFKEDDATEAYQQTITVDATASPITSLDTV